MQISVSGKHVDLGEAFQKHVEARMDEGVHKYLDRVNKVDVIATKESSVFCINIHANTGTSGHVVVKSHAEDHDIYAAFDKAADKVEKQLRRYKRRLKNHHKERERDPEAEEINFAKAMHRTLEAEKADELEEEGGPVVIAEDVGHLEVLTVSDAVMRMDLEDAPAFVFIEKKTNRLNVIYRRPDGNIAWVDPEEVAAKAAA